MLIDITKSSYNSNLSSGIEQKGSITTTKYNISDENLYVASSNDNNFDDPSLVSAHYNASLVYDYFLETHDRTSIDGKGGTIISMTNLKNEDGDDEDNATWNGKWISYGNGRVSFKPLAGALDVAAHEFTHGVVEWTAALEYRDESGALNESFSDVFGLMLDRDDWTLGEDIVNIEYFPNGCLRSLEEPELGNQPSHYDDYVVGGGVHSTVPAEDWGQDLVRGVQHRRVLRLGFAGTSSDAELRVHRVTQPSAQSADVPHGAGRVSPLQSIFHQRACGRPARQVILQRRRRLQGRSPGPGPMLKDVLAQRSPRKQAQLQLLQGTRPEGPEETHGQGQLIVEDIGDEARPKGGRVFPTLGRPWPLQTDTRGRPGIEGHGVQGGRAPGPAELPELKRGLRRLQAG